VLCVFRGHVPGRSSLAGTLRGREAVVGYINTVFERVHGRVEVDLVDLLVGTDRVALILDERLTTDDGVVSIPRVNVYRVAGEQIVEIRIFEGDQYAVDELLG